MKEMSEKSTIHRNENKMSWAYSIFLDFMIIKIYGFLPKYQHLTKAFYNFYPNIYILDRLGYLSK